MQIWKRKQALIQRKSERERLSTRPSWVHDEIEKELRKSLPGEPRELKKQVRKILDLNSIPYSETTKKRDISRGLLRIGTTFRLREDFYSAMWIYLHKVDTILGIKPQEE